MLFDIKAFTHKHEQIKTSAGSLDQIFGFYFARKLSLLCTYYLTYLREKPCHMFFKNPTRPLGKLATIPDSPAFILTHNCESGKCVVPPLLSHHSRLARPHSNTQL